jgi:hypothetical protein
MIIRYEGKAGDSTYPAWIPFDGYFEIKSNYDNGFDLVAETTIGKVTLITKGSQPEIERLVTNMAIANADGEAEFKLTEDL